MRMVTQQSNDSSSLSLDFFDEAIMSTGESSESSGGSPAFTFSGFRAPNSTAALDVFETKALARTIIQKRFKEGEWEALLEERQQLLDKKFSGTMTKSDSNRLDYVRWSLDQIEDARHGAALDMLEVSVARYEHFLEGVERLNRELARNVPMARKR